MSTVFLLTTPSVSRKGELPDLSGLKPFGEVKVLVQQGDNPLTRSTQTLATIRRRLEGFNPDEDYFVNAGGGSTVSALLLGIALTELDVQRINWLSYRNAPDETTGLPRTWYTPIVMDLVDIHLEDVHG